MCWVENWCPLTVWKAGLYPELGAALADRIRAQKKELGRRGAGTRKKKAAFEEGVLGPALEG